MNPECGAIPIWFEFVLLYYVWGLAILYRNFTLGAHHCLKQRAMVVTVFLVSRVGLWESALRQASELMLPLRIQLYNSSLQNACRIVSSPYFLGTLVCVSQCVDCAGWCARVSSRSHLG